MFQKVHKIKMYFSVSQYLAAFHAWWPPFQWLTHGSKFLPSFYAFILSTQIPGSLKEEKWQFPKYRNSPCNSTMTKKTTQSKMDVFDSKKTYRWPVFKEDVRMAKRHTKRCSTSLTIGEMKIKTMIRFHLTPVRMAIIKKSTNNECSRGCG